MKQVVDGKLYDTEKASLVAHNRYWDGHNWERRGRNTYLYKTAKGNFFLAHITLWPGERDYIQPINVTEAKEHYEKLPEHELEYQEVFGESPEEA